MPFTLLPITNLACTIPFPLSHLSTLKLNYFLHSYATNSLFSLSVLPLHPQPSILFQAPCLSTPTPLPNFNQILFQRFLSLLWNAFINCINYLLLFIVNWFFSCFISQKEVHKFLKKFFTRETAYLRSSWTRMNQVNPLTT